MELDKKLEYFEMVSNGYICEEISDFINFICANKQNEIIGCGISNPKAPDPYIVLKNEMNYEMVTSYVDNAKFLKDNRSENNVVCSVYCRNPEHFSATVIYDGKIPYFWH